MIDRTSLRGVIPSLPTVFDSDGGIDLDALRAVTRFALDCGAHGLVCLGLAGEVSRVSVDERERLLEVVIDENAGAVPVLTGVTAENLVMSQRLARHAEEVGATGIVLPPPTAYRLSEEDLITFFAEVAGATSLPALIQDAPEYLDVALRPGVVIEAARRTDAVSGVKLETSAEGIEKWRAELGSDFAIYGGSGGVFLLDCLRAGADGVMPGVDTTDRQVEIVAAEFGGDHARADHLFAELLPMLVFEMQSIDHYNACAKYVLRRRGIEIETDLRAPGPRTLPPASIARLESHVIRLGLAAGAAPTVETAN